MIVTIVLLVAPFVVVLIITAYTSDCIALAKLFQASRVKEIVICAASLSLSTGITLVYVIAYYLVKISRPDQSSNGCHDDNETVVNSLKAAVETVTNMFTVVLIYNGTSEAMSASSHIQTESSFGSSCSVSSFLFNLTSVPLQYNILSAQFALNELSSIIGKSLHKAYICFMTKRKEDIVAVEEVKTQRSGTEKISY
eukprot:sb/3470849/